jgi:hypothetical protein
MKTEKIETHTEKIETHTDKRQTPTVYTPYQRKGKHKKDYSKEHAPTRPKTRLPKCEYCFMRIRENHSCKKLREASE